MGHLFADDTFREDRGSKRQLSFDTLYQQGCKACPLDKMRNLQHPKMEATGAGRPLIYVLGEAPGAEEDKTGRQFVGDAGELLREHLPEGVLPRLRWNNSVNCRPPKNATPSRAELTCCRSRIVGDIERSKPRALFGFGGVPLQWVIGEDKITTWSGLFMPVKIGDHACWFFPFYHPSWLRRMRRSNRRGDEFWSEKEEIFDRHLRRAFKLVKKLPPATVVEGDEIREGISYVTGKDGWEDVSRIKKELKRFGSMDAVAFDYETASDDRERDRKVRPYGKNARILTVAVGTSSEAFAFPIAHREALWTRAQRRAIDKAWVAFLYSGAEKIAHNLFFELEWTLFFYGKDLARCAKWHDTMAQAYVLGMPSGTTSLNALTLINFGFKLKEETKINLNDLDREPLERVLGYNALDAKWEHALWEIQNIRLDLEGLGWLYQDQVRRTPTIALKSYYGMLIDFDAVVEFDKDYSPRIEALLDWFAKSKSAVRFREKFGKDFKPTSSQDAVLFFHKLLGRDECLVERKKSDRGAGKYRLSAEDDVLEKIPLKAAKKMRELRAVTGNKSKYVDLLFPDGAKPGYTTKQSNVGRVVWPDGLTHAALKVLFLVTRRSSCTFPNEQYWPKRDENYTTLRKIFTAPGPGTRRMLANHGYDWPSHLNPEDCWFVAVDYGQIQARIAGMLSNDKLYCSYLWDRNDLHMRWTKKLARAYPERIGGREFLKDKVALNRFRTDVKNQWTFPLIFGAVPSSVSKYLHIPESYIRSLIDQFFEEMPGLKDYQERMIDFYNTNGYVETPNGWRRYGPMDIGEIINTPIQSGEADIVFDAMNRLSEAAAELDMWQFQAILEVHDELGFWIPKTHFDRDLEFIADYMLECKHYPWINVPLCIEVGRGPNWYKAGLKESAVSVIYSDDLGKLDRAECGF